MLQENKKMFFHTSKKVIETEFHTDRRKIIADILETAYQEDVKDYELEIDFSNIIFLDTDTQKPSILEIGSEFFEEFQDLPNIKFPVKIKTYPPVAALNNDLLYNSSLVILGFINNIHPAIYDKIMNYPGLEVYIFGDIQVESNEFNNYHMRILSNAPYIHKIDPDLFRLVDKKKINTTLHKLRKDSAINLSELSNSSLVSLKYDSNIELSYINQYLETHENSICVVPRSTMSRINSMLWNMKYGQKISFQPGCEFYLKYPYTHITQNNEYVQIPALTKVTIILEPDVHYEKILENGHRLISVKAYFDLNDERYIPDTNIIVDLDDLLLSFDPSLQPENYYDYLRIVEITEELERTRSEMDLKRINICDHYIAYLTPFLVVTPEVMKYKNFNNILGYLEIEERDLAFSYDSYYKQFCRVLDSIEIHYAETYMDINVVI